MSNALPVQVIYSREILVAAAQCFVKRYFRGWGRWLLVACVINPIGFAVALAFGASDTLTIVAGGIVVIVGPLYCTYLFTLFPRRYASRVAGALVPGTQFSFTPWNFEMMAKERVSRIPWARIKEVWECAGAFLLVLSQFGVVFIVVPKTNLPQSAHEILVGKSKDHAA
jgi:hypothetical protein